MTRTCRCHRGPGRGGRRRAARHHLPARALAGDRQDREDGHRPSSARRARGACRLEMQGRRERDRQLQRHRRPVLPPSETCPTGQLAIVLDSVVKSAPTIQQAVVRGATRSRSRGSFSESEAKDLALVLRYGSLPVNLEPQTVQTVSPTLGEDSLRAGPDRRARRPRARVPLHALLLPGPRASW